MKVLMINGSPRANGNTARALKEVAGTLGAEGIETETVWTGNKPVRGCVACYQCKAKNLGKCVFNDDAANGIIEKLKEAIQKSEEAHQKVLDSALTDARLKIEHLKDQITYLRSVNDQNLKIISQQNGMIEKFLSR